MLSLSSSDSGCVEPDQEVRLPEGLLRAIIDRIPLPILVGCASDDPVLNGKAREVWLSADPYRIGLSASAKARLRSLWSMLAQSDSCVPRFLAPDGKQYTAATFPWHEETGSPTWRVAVLQPENPNPPVDPNPTEGELFRDKINRLKAIVHELRNTLTAAREALSFLREEWVGELNAQQRRFLDSAMEDLEHLVRAMVDLTSLWVTRAGVMRILSRPLDVRRVVDQATLNVRSTAEKAGVSLRVEFGSPSPVLTGDYDLLVQALRNVLINGIQHTPAGGTITVRSFLRDSTGDTAPLQGDTAPLQGVQTPEDPTRLAGWGDDEEVVIEIQDSGVGIAPQDQQRVFEPFERGASSNADDGDAAPLQGGMGLGLSIARDIAWTHGGTLTIQSAIGRGARFVFRFPKLRTSARSWMIRATQRAIEDVRPLRVPLAGVLLEFEPDRLDLPDEDSRSDQHFEQTSSVDQARSVHRAKQFQQTKSVRNDLLSNAGQLAALNLRPADTVLAVEGKLLLLLMPGGTRDAAHAMVDRILCSLGTATRGDTVPLHGDTVECHCSVSSVIRSVVVDIRTAETAVAHGTPLHGNGAPLQGNTAPPQGDEAVLTPCRIRFGIASFPEDGHDAETFFKVLRRRCRASSQSTFCCGGKNSQ